MQIGPTAGEVLWWDYWVRRAICWSWESQSYSWPESSTNLGRTSSSHRIFSLILENIETAAISKPLADLTTKKVPGTIPSGQTQNDAIEQLKTGFV